MNNTNLYNYFNYIIPQISKLAPICFTILQDWIVTTLDLSKSIIASSTIMRDKLALKDIISLFFGIQMKVLFTFANKIILVPVFTLGHQIGLIISQIFKATLALFKVSVNASIVQVFENAYKLVVTYGLFFDLLLIVFFILSMRWLLNFLVRLYIDYNILLIFVTIFLAFTS